VFAKVIVRDNKVRYLDGGYQSTYLGYGLQINSAANLIVRNNVVDSAPTTPPPIQNNRCNSVTYFNNLTSGGVLVPGTNGDNNIQYEELATLTDFALIMGLFNKKA